MRATSKPSIGAAQAGVRMAEAGLRQAEAGLRQAQVEQANADAELARSRSLQAQAFVSAQAVDAAQRRADAARASAASAQATIAQAQASVGQAQAQLKVQRVNEDYALIRAPFDGVVLVKNANVGDIITPFSSAAGTQGAVVTMADMSTLEVEADVSEGNLAKARTGQPVEITLDALPDARFRGNVVGIVPTVDRAKATVMTKIRFEKLDPRILPEMSAKVTILSQPASDADQQAGAGDQSAGRGGARRREGGVPRQGRHGRGRAGDARPQARRHRGTAGRAEVGRQARAIAAREAAAGRQGRAGGQVRHCAQPGEVPS